jgi:hypothetical protein
MDGRLEIYTLGGVRILRGGEPIAGLGHRKAEALLIYLASTRRSQPREVLADLFLPTARSQSTGVFILQGGRFQPHSKTNCAGASYDISTRQSTDQ